jgi:hypothetical protein
VLRACLVLKERDEIDKYRYGSLIRFIKKKNVGYWVNKSKMFTRKQVVRTAPPESF